MPINFKLKEIERGDVRFGANAKDAIYTIPFIVSIAFPMDGATIYKAPLDIDISELVHNLKDSYIVDYGDNTPVFIDVACRFKNIYHEYDGGGMQANVFKLEITSTNIEPNLDTKIIDAVLETANGDIPYKIYIKRGV